MLQNRFKYWRHKKMMNQKQFAKFLGIDHTQYNRYERNPKMIPHLETMWKIAKRLECNIEDLVEEAPDE